MNNKLNGYAQWKSKQIYFYVYRKKIKTNIYNKN